MSDLKYNEEAYERVKKIFKASEAERDFFFCDFTSDLEKKGISLDELAQKDDECINQVIEDFAWAHRWDPFFG